MISDGSVIRWDVRDELRWRLLDFELQGRRAMYVKPINERELMRRAGKRGREPKMFQVL